MHQRSKTGASGAPNTFEEMGSRRREDVSRCTGASVSCTARFREALTPGLPDEEDQDLRCPRSGTQQPRKEGHDRGSGRREEARRRGGRGSAPLRVWEPGTNREPGPEKTKAVQPASVALRPRNALCPDETSRGSHMTSRCLTTWRSAASVASPLQRRVRRHPRRRPTCCDAKRTPYSNCCR